MMKYLAPLGVGGILAAMFYYQNNKNAIDYAQRSEATARLFADRIEALLNVERGRTEMLVKLVTDNTAQTSANTEVVRALHRRLDKEEIENRQEKNQ
jgi:hypothetical protein